MGSRIHQRGFVLVTMALTSAAVFGLVGLAVDVGRMFVAKNELQVYCDAAATSAAMMLDGTTAGISRATDAVGASANKWNFDTSTITNPSVLFANSASGPWIPSPNPAAGYSLVKVTASASVSLYFIPILTGQGTFTVTATAAAGQIPLTSLGQGLAPYTAVSTSGTAPSFGFVVGGSYTVHWPTFNGNRSGCDDSNPDKCFNSPPCADDSLSSQTAVVDDWGSQYHGYWGSNSNSAITSSVLDDIQLAPISIGMNIDPLLSSGDKAAEAGTLDTRVNQDTDTTDNTPSSYLANSSHNGRRLLPVAIVTPVDPSHTTVIGFGVFLLLSNGSPSDYYKTNTNGNSPYCALYVGPYTIGASGPGVGGSSGGANVELVQ